MPFSRAERIARTEINRALRNAAYQQYQTSRVVTGYRRMCYPPTACLACLALDGEYYPMSAGVLSDHPNGKCSMIPWRDPNKPPDWQTGRQWLMEQTEEDQWRIMGAGRFELWKQGADLRGMVYLKESPIWGGQPAVKTLDEIRMGAGETTPSSVSYSLERFFCIPRCDIPSDKALEGTNPNYSTGLAEWRENCQRCVPVYEARRRGYNIEALPCNMRGEDDVADHWTEIFDGVTWEDWHSYLPGTGRQEIESLMKQWGDGARAEIYVQWRNNDPNIDVAHVFAAENIGGMVRYYCPQSNDPDFRWDAYVKDGMTAVLRIDDKEFSPWIQKCGRIKP